MIPILVALLGLAHADPWEEVAAVAELDVAAAKALMQGVEKDQTVLDRMATPWEAKPWHQYAKIFSDDKRLNDGVAFWKKHEAKLAEVQANTGVPAQIIVAILGVETRYGTVMGDDTVARALFTLGFHHERRGSFFRKELGHYLRLATDEKWELQTRKGSYAGAMGMGQFIPSSYRNFAVDGDGDGKRDLFDNPDDAIASVGNYFLVHGWLTDAPVLLPAKGAPDALAKLVTEGLKPEQDWTALAAAGVSVEGPAPQRDDKAKIFAFELEKGTDYQVGLHNFYVITRYNHSPLYARAVYDLSERLLEAHRAL